MIDFFNNTLIFNNSLTKWLACLAVIAVAILVRKAIRWIFKNVFIKITSKTKNSYDDVLVQKTENPIVFGIGYT